MIYPPRATKKTTVAMLHNYETGYLAQAKFNGSYAVVYPNGDVYNRHGKKVDWNIDCPIDGIVCGEYMNKGERYNSCNFIVHDLLQLNGEWLYSATYKTRIEALQYLCYKIADIDEGADMFVRNILDSGLGIVKSYNSCFESLYEDAIQHNILEGLVIKRGNAKLKPCVAPESNTKWSLKIRKPSKVYAL